MKNVHFEVKGKKLIITVDLTKDFGKSPSGKSICVASTSGNITPDGVDDPGLRVGLNVYRTTNQKSAA